MRLAIVPLPTALFLLAGQATGKERAELATRIVARIKEFEHEIPSQPIE